MWWLGISNETLPQRHTSTAHMGKFGSDSNSSAAGVGSFKPRPSGIKKHSGGDKRHDPRTPTGKFGFARLQNDDSGDAGARRREGESDTRKAAHSDRPAKNKSLGQMSSQAQAGAPSSVRSALKHVAVEQLVANGAKKSKLLQKVYDCDAFTGKLNPPSVTAPICAWIVPLTFTYRCSVTGLASMDAAQRLNLFWVAATSMRDSPASGLQPPSPLLFRCVRAALLYFPRESSAALHVRHVLFGGYSIDAFTA
jgi:hypothetical protein